MKNLKYIFIVLCTLRILIHASVAAEHSLDEYANAFTIESLKEYVIDHDEDALNRVVFPKETFKLDINDPEKMRKVLDDYFSQNKAIIWYETAYLHVFNYRKASRFIDLQVQLLDTYFSLHRVIVKTAILPYLAVTYKEKKLGLIKDEDSLIRKMMKEYSEYFFGSLRKSHTIDQEFVNEKTSYQSTPILKSDTCPVWIVWRLNRAVRIHFNKFVEHYKKIDEIRAAMNEPNRFNPTCEETLSNIKAYGFSIRQLLPDLIDGEDDKSQGLRRDLGKALIEIMREKYDLTPSQVNSGLDYIIVHRNLARALKESKSALVSTITQKKRTRRMKKKIINFEYINGNKLKEIVELDSAL